MVDWELICQLNKAQINKYNIRKKKIQVDHDYNVRNKVILSNNAVYKYEIPYNGPFFITRCLPMER